METNEFVRLLEALGQQQNLAGLQSAGPTGGGGLLGQLNALAGATGTAKAGVDRKASSRIGEVAAAGGGLAVLPVIGGLLRLFGGGKKKPLPEMEPFQLPNAIRAEAALRPDGSTYLVDRGAGSVIRPLVNTSSPAPAQGQAPFHPGTGGTQINVHVQAMDSQSFLDRKDDIARAVREAMLYSHSLNDVVSEI